jgi:hypothetical protein
MAILTPPTVAVERVNWGLIANSQGFEGELTRDGQEVALPGDRWSTVLTVTNLMGREARAWFAFIASLRGRTGRFWLSPPGQVTHYGTALGSGAVKGANQTGSTLVTDGWTPDQAELMAVGDYFQVGYELKLITAVSASNGAGEATLHFTPPLRRSPADNASIITTNPACVAKLVDDNQAKFDLQGARIYAMTHAVIEALDI